MQILLLTFGEAMRAITLSLSLVALAVTTLAAMATTANAEPTARHRYTDGSVVVSGVDPAVENIYLYFPIRMKRDFIDAQIDQYEHLVEITTRPNPLPPAQRCRYEYSFDYQSVYKMAWTGERELGQVMTLGGNMYDCATAQFIGPGVNETVAFITVPEPSSVALLGLATMTGLALLCKPSSS